MQPSGTILIIEPGNQERQYWMKRLKTSFPGCDVLEAEAGGEGIAASQSQRIDCIVVELLLPDMSIFEVIGEFLSLVRYPGIAVIVLSPQPSLPMRPLVLSDGAQVLLATSRMSGDELEKAIENALAALSTDSSSAVVSRLSQADASFYMERLIPKELNIPLNPSEEQE